MTGHGGRQITAFHVAGDMADLHSAVRPIGVGGLTALADTTVLKIPHGAVRSLAAAYPAVAEALWRDCMLDAAILMEWSINIGRRGAVSRLAHLFCEMSLRYAQNTTALTSYSFPVTQEQLADVAALTSVHVNRSIRDLRQRGLVTFRNGSVDIADWKALARVGDFDAEYLMADTCADWKQRSSHH